MGRSLKKGPFIDQKLLAKIDAMNDSGQKRPIKNMVKKIYNLTRFCGPHLLGS